MRRNFYKISNISGQRVTVEVVREDGQHLEDFLEIDEVVYGLNDRAASQLKVYEFMGLIKIEMTEFDEDPKVRWLTEGF